MRSPPRSKSIWFCLLKVARQKKKNVFGQKRRSQKRKKPKSCHLPFFLFFPFSASDDDEDDRSLFVSHLSSTNPIESRSHALKNSDNVCVCKGVCVCFYNENEWGVCECFKVEESEVCVFYHERKCVCFIMKESCVCKRYDECVHTYMYSTNVESER